MTKSIARGNHVVLCYPSQRDLWNAAASRTRHPKAWWARGVLQAAVEGRLKVRLTEDLTIPRGRIEHNEKTVQYQFRASTAEVKRWTIAAKAEGLDRGEWQRQCFNAAATKTDLRFLL